MLKVSAEAVETESVFRSSVYLRDVRYEDGQLVARVTCPGEGLIAAVTFTEVVGFRLLDEGNLLEFWPVCAADRGWLFRVTKNGWLNQEIARPGFLTDATSGPSEYFIASANDCLSVMTGKKPRVDIHNI